MSICLQNGLGLLVDIMVNAHYLRFIDNSKHMRITWMLKPTSKHFNGKLGNQSEMLSSHQRWQLEGVEKEINLKCLLQSIGGN